MTTAISSETGNSRVLTTESGLNFQHSDPQSKRKYSIDLSYTSSDRWSNNNSTSTTSIIVDSQSSYSPLQYLSQSYNGSGTILARLHYYFPLSKKALVEIGYDWQHINTKSNLTTGMLDSNTGKLIPIDSLSAEYSLISSVRSIFLSWLMHSSRWNLNLSLVDGNQTGTIVGKGNIQHYSYFEWLPKAEAAYTISPVAKLNLEYAARPALPAFQQLFPVTNLNNPQYPTQGNPNLIPALTQSLSLKYQNSSLKANRNGNFGLGLSYAATEHAIATSQTHPLDSSAVIARTTYVNLNGFTTIKLEHYFIFPSFWKDRIRLGTSGNLSLNTTSNLTDNTLYTTRSFGWTQSLQLSVKMMDEWESTLSGGFKHSFTHSSLPDNSVIPSSTLSWSLNSRYTLLQQWIVQYIVSQLLTSGLTDKLLGNPILINASLQRDFLANNQLGLGIAVTNI